MVDEENSALFTSYAGHLLEVFLGFQCFEVKFSDADDEKGFPRPPGDRLRD